MQANSKGQAAIAYLRRNPEDVNGTVEVVLKRDLHQVAFLRSEVGAGGLAPPPPQLAKGGAKKYATAGARAAACCRR